MITSSLRFTIWCISAVRFSNPIPCVENVCFALWKCSEESKSAFEGIQPTFKHVPPNVSYFSINAVLKPNCAQRIAATYPPGPDPIMATSYELILFDF